MSDGDQQSHQRKQNEGGDSYRHDQTGPLPVAARDCLPRSALIPVHDGGVQSDCLTAAPGGHIAHDAATKSLLRRVLAKIRYFSTYFFADQAQNIPCLGTHSGKYRIHLTGRYQPVYKLPHKISQGTQPL